MRRKLVRTSTGADAKSQGRTWVLGAVPGLLILFVALSGCGWLATSESARTEAGIGPEGGTVTLGELTLVVPEGALAKEVDLVVRKVSEHPAGNVGPVFSIEPAEGAAGDSVTFAKEVTLTLAVPAGKLKMGQEYGDLKLAHAESGAWIPLASSVADPGKEQVTGKTSHLSLWTVVVAPKCDGPEDCAEGLKCEAGICVAPPVCKVWDLVSEEALDKAGQCYLDKVGPLFADLKMGEVYFPTVSAAGVIGCNALYTLRTLFTSTLDEDESEYRLDLPCSGLSVTLEGEALKQAPMVGKGLHIVPPECLDGQECACDHCVRAVVSAGGGKYPAIGGKARLRCPPSTTDCPPMGYCFEMVDLDLGFVDGKRWWLRLNTGEPEYLPKEEWIAAMEALETPAASCAFALGTELTFYNNTCFGASVKCGGKSQNSACHMASGDDSMCAWETGDEGMVVGLCDLGGITCEKPEVWDIHYAVDAPATDCEFCWGSDDKNLCVPLDVQCGGVVELPPEVASGSKEGGPHPMTECTEWAVCPEDLQECYESYPEGQECISGRMNVRFVAVPFGGGELCKDAVAGPDEPTECIYYHDSVSGNPIYCCNGYVANRTTWILEEPEFECCKAALAMHYPGTDISPFTDANGHFNAGLTLQPELGEPLVTNVVCMEWFTATGTSWSGFIGSEPDMTVQLYTPEILTENSQTRVVCSPSADPIFDKPVPLAKLDIAPDGKWLSPSGEDCNDIQEAAHP
jgi:hypothetical protein